MTNPDNKIIRANNNGILLPRGIVILSAVAVLCVIIDLIGGLIEYFQDDKLRIVRISLPAASAF